VLGDRGQHGLAVEREIAFKGTPTKSMPANWAERWNITKAGIGASTTARLSCLAQAMHRIEMISSEPLPRMTS
jgi:hypothetical protein